MNSGSFQKKVSIEKMAYSLPEEAFTSEDLENELELLYKRLNLPKGRLELMTGLKERRFWPSNYEPSSASAEAGGKLLAMGVDKDEIDLLIHSSVCRDRLEPATASYVHRKLNLSSKTQILDISNACLGFINSLILASGMIESGQIKRAMIVAGENGKPLIDRTLKILNHSNFSRKEIKPFFANLTIGAGASLRGLSQGLIWFLVMLLKFPVLPVKQILHTIICVRGIVKVTNLLCRLTQRNYYMPAFQLPVVLGTNSKK